MSRFSSLDKIKKDEVNFWFLIASRLANLYSQEEQEKRNEYYAGGNDGRGKKN
jgi:hypothetical protein